MTGENKAIVQTRGGPAELTWGEDWYALQCRKADNVVFMLEGGVGLTKAEVDAAVSHWKGEKP